MFVNAAHLSFLLYQIMQIILLSKTSNVLCEGWQPKTTSALASETNQKTEDFELSTGSSQGKRENWILVCGEFNQESFTVFSNFKSSFILCMANISSFNKI